MSYAPWTGTINFPGSELEPEAAAAVPDLNLLIVPLDSSPNQSFQTTLLVDGRNLTVELSFRYNEMAGYWVMRITDPETGEIVIDSVPLITGAYPAANLLEQFAYLQIGSAYVIPAGGSALDYPDDTTLGDYFFLVWSDTPVSP